PSDVENGIVEALKTVYDPEIPVNIYELGLIYDIDIQEDGAVKVKMTLTAPGCPVAGSLPGEVQDKVAGAPGVTSAEVELVWDPAWHPSMLSEGAPPGWASFCRQTKFPPPREKSPGWGACPTLPPPPPPTPRPPWGWGGRSPPASGAPCGATTFLPKTPRTSC